jgi:hypothetical protein
MVGSVANSVWAVAVKLTGSGLMGCWGHAEIASPNACPATLSRDGVVRFEQGILRSALLKILSPTVRMEDR